jgi:hypothetical protein
MWLDRWSSEEQMLLAGRCGLIYYERKVLFGS